MITKIKNLIKRLLERYFKSADVVDYINGAESLPPHLQKKRKQEYSTL